MHKTIVVTPLTDPEEKMCDRFADSMYCLGLLTRSQTMDFRGFTAILQDLHHILNCRALQRVVNT